MTHSELISSGAVIFGVVIVVAWIRVIRNNWDEML